MTLFALDRVAGVVQVAVKRLQGKVTLVQQQHCHVKELTERLKELCPSYSLEEEDERENEESGSEEHVRVNTTRVRLSSARSFLDDLGMVVQTLRNGLTEREAHDVEASTARLFAGIIDGLNKMLKNDKDVQQQTELPSPLPSDLLRMKPASFTAIVQRYYSKLKAAGWTPVSIEQLERDHRKLLEVAKNENQRTMNELDEHESFEKQWKLFRNEGMEELETFCGGLASVFPSTATVEADFSCIRLEKSEFRSNMTDFSLESLLQCKQFDEVQSLIVL